MQKVTISTAALPEHLDDRARFKLWHDTYCEWVSRCDMKRLSDDPFVGQWEFSAINDIKIGRFRGTPHAATRTPRQISATAPDYVSLGFNLAPAALSFSQRQRDNILPGAQPLFYSVTDAYHYVGASDYIAVAMPKRALQALLPNVETFLSTRLDGSLPAMRYLCRYLGLLNEPDGIWNDSALLDHAQTTIQDLVALALGAAGDGAVLARMRGLRAARYAEILGVVGNGFADPAFSVQRVASVTGLSPSYIQKILHEAGLSLTERVLELRLSKARAMLANRRNDALRVSEIALACGFNEVSYFNRCFRRRFGAAPNDFRGGDVADQG